LLIPPRFVKDNFVQDSVRYSWFELGICLFGCK